MLFEFFIVLAAVVLSLVESSFLSALPPGWNFTPSLILIIGLIAVFRFRTALIAAAAAGFVADAVTSTFVGPHLVSALVTAGAGWWLFTRVFANPTLPSFLAMNASVFAVHRSLAYLVRTAGDSLTVGAVSPPWPSLATFEALLLQLLAAAAALAIARSARRFLAARFIFSGHAA
ncbi:MAG: hypothetical protein PHT12_01235 [Patescibacteria group bacterium]|nr:hypothetical protein [Patescibacteria group bacterium]